MTTCGVEENRVLHSRSFHLSNDFQGFNSPPPRYPSGRVLASSAGGPGFNLQSRTASYQRRYKNGDSNSLVKHSTLKREILALSQELR